MKYKYANFNKNTKLKIRNLLLNDLIDNYDSQEIYYNDYGKPYIKDNNIYFNISHSYDYLIVCTSEYEVGIDIEKIRPVKKELIDYIATENEKEYIYSEKANIEKRVFEIYTLKEAYFKMLGTGLQDFKSVEFSIANNRVICKTKKIHSSLYYDIDGYVFAICEL